MIGIFLLVKNVLNKSAHKEVTMIKEIIEQYKQYQIDNKLTQQEAADKVHISRTHLSRIFNGERTPSIALLSRMEEVMKTGNSSKI